MSSTLKRSARPVWSYRATESRSGDGDLTKALTVKAHKFSKSAVAKIARPAEAEVI
jgi:hypothetical protein